MGGKAYTSIPLASLRKEPCFTSNVVSQSVLGETLSIQEKKDGWFLITTEDHYPGWVPAGSVSERPYSGALRTSRLSSHLYRTPDLKGGAMATLPYHANLQQVRVENASWLQVTLPDGTLAFIQQGDVAQETCPDLITFSHRFLGIPYTWGGRSSFGYDCSGFVQMLYGQIGILLPRDSKDQILSPRLKRIPALRAKEGDLIFFGNTPHDIRHVAFFLGNGQFIHATGQENRPWIRISHLADPAWDGTPSAIYPFRSACALSI